MYLVDRYNIINLIKLMDIYYKLSVDTFYAVTLAMAHRSRGSDPPHPIQSVFIILSTANFVADKLWHVAKLHVHCSVNYSTVPHLE